MLYWETILELYSKPILHFSYISPTIDKSLKGKIVNRKKQKSEQLFISLRKISEY